MQFHRKYILSLCALSSIILSGVQAMADDKADFNKLVEDPTEQLLVMEAARQSPVVLQNSCNSADFTILNRFAIYTPLKFDDSGKVTAGAWKETISEKGCGEEKLLQVVVFFDTRSNSLKAVPLFPGTTRADPILQHDAQMYAMIAATSPGEENCKDIYVSDTQFLHEVGEPLEGAKGKPWDELWTLNVCGKKAQVTMHFIPDKTGTTIQTDLQETKF